MILQDSEIRRRKLITPYNEEQLQPGSYDLRLSEADRQIIKPLEKMLASTVETVKIPPDLMGEIKGKSSIARLGLQVECAGLCDPGFEGTITLELFNQSNRVIDLSKINCICQIRFEEMKGIPEKIYGECGNHYQGQEGITKSWIERSNEE